MWKKIVFGVALIISGAVGFGVAKMQVSVNQTLSHVERNHDTALSTVDLKGIKVKSDKSIVNILLIGNDYRKEKGYYASGLTDAMMVATMDKKHHVLKLTTLMRDTLVYIPNKNTYMKLNAANTFGGIPNLYKTIAYNFGLKLDGYVEVDMKAFSQAVDAVGGVDVKLTESEAIYLNNSNYIRKKKDRTVKKGTQTLTGAQAIGYVRIRKGTVTLANGTKSYVYTPTGLTDDWARTWRQRFVMNAIFQEVKKEPMSKWMDIAATILDGNVTTDLSNKQIYGYMKDVATMGTTEIHQMQIPMNSYMREGNPSGAAKEFSDTDNCLVPTDGVSSTNDITVNANALNEFIFNYNGKDEYTYPLSGSTASTTPATQ